MIREIIKKTIEWLVTIRLLAPFGKFINIAINYAVLIKNGVILYYDDPERSKVINLIKKIKLEVKLLMEINEAYQVYMAVKNTKKIKGNIAEIGVYRGGSAKIICEAKEDKSLHLFDTFEGIPELSKWDTGDYHKGELQASLKDVKSYLNKYRNVYFYKGLFPSTAKPIRNKKFSFVNIDVDIYESTLNCLKFFYTRMNPGGVIISHDYINKNAAGVRKAFDNFFKDKPEPIIEISGSQCLIVKL